MAHGLKSLRGMWDPPRPGLEPVSPAPAGGLPTTAPPGKPKSNFKRYIFFLILDAPLLLVPLLGVGVGDHD